MKIKHLVIAACVLLSACSFDVKTTHTDEIKSDNAINDFYIARFERVSEFTTSRGDYCVIINGAGITCDWKKHEN